MTIETKVLKEALRKLLRKLNYKTKFGVIFNGNYICGFNETGYELVKLPMYISDSFILPMKVIPIIGNLSGDTVTILRDDKYMQILSGDCQQVINFTQETDLNAVMDDFTSNLAA